MIYTKYTIQGKEQENFELSHTKVSLTIPDQSLTINEILRRSGVIDIAKDIYYDENPDHDSILDTERNGFDLSDVSATANAVAIRAAERKAKAEALSEEAEAKRLAEEQEAKAKAESEKPT